MAPASKLTGIGHIVRIRQKVRQWRERAHTQSSVSPSSPPSDVPAGHLAVCVGSTQKRFVVRTSSLNHPVFVELLSQAEEEYGFSSSPGPLAIPCDETVFEHIIRNIETNPSSTSSSFSRSIVGVR